MDTATIDLSEDGTVEKPVNREPDMHTLVSSFLTHTLNYDRNHGSIQHRSVSGFQLTIDGLVTKKTFTYADLISQFPQHKVVCAVQCAGNRRHTMRTRIKEVSGVDWFDAAMMNCKWEGPRLCDVLRSAGVDSSKPLHASVQPQHVQFASYGGKTQEDEFYGGSIPFQRAMNEGMDVILAVKMNDALLQDRHGFPVRVIVPGVLGARSVKWLDHITVSDKESPCYYQHHDYKILPPDAVDAESADKYWSKVPPMLEMPINACVADPESESTVTLSGSGEVEVKGYAVPQGSQGPVTRVQVSGDEGTTWIDADLNDGGEDASKWSWVLWNAKVPMKKGSGQKIFAKATDAGGNTQEDAHSQWNLRGVAYNGFEAVWDLEVV